jgi:hypothetical protein
MNCGRRLYTNRLAGKDTYPVVDEPEEIFCYQTDSVQPVLAEPDLDSERLYAIGPANMLQIVGERPDFYAVLLPGHERGYVQKSTGRVYEMGTGEVKDPLGWIQALRGKTGAAVVCVQPHREDELETLQVLGAEGCLPVVAERDESFKVQLASGLRGYVPKAYVVRMLSRESLSLPDEGDEGSSDTAALLIGLAAIAGLVFVGGVGGLLAGDSEERKIERSMDRALSRRGL